MAKIEVIVDKDLEAIIPQFMENREEDIKKINKLLEEDNYTEIERIGHSMKGSGGGYGFDKITEIGKEIEEGAIEKDEEKIVNKINELKKYLEEVEIVYK